MHLLFQPTRNLTLDLLQHQTGCSFQKNQEKRKSNSSDAPSRSRLPEGCDLFHFLVAFNTHTWLIFPLPVSSLGAFPKAPPGLWPAALGGTQRMDRTKTGRPDIKNILFSTTQIFDEQSFPTNCSSIKETTSELIFSSLGPPLQKVLPKAMTALCQSEKNQKNNKSSVNKSPGSSL